MADKENSPPLEIHRYLCKFNDKMTREYSGSKLGPKRVIMLLTARRNMDISIGNGGKTDIKKHTVHKKNARTY